MNDKDVKKLIKQIFYIFEKTQKTADKIDKCFGGANDILQPILIDLVVALDTGYISSYDLGNLLNDIKSGDKTVKEAANIYFTYLKG